MKHIPPPFGLLRAGLFLLVLVSVRLCLQAAPVHELVTSFERPPKNPSFGCLVLGPDGYYWGTTQGGGTFGNGTIYKMSKDGSQWTTVVSFTDTGVNKGRGPSGGLLKLGNDVLWGTTAAGGADGFGTVFKLNAATGLLTTVLEFTKDGATNRGYIPVGRLVEDGMGFVWGTTAGAVNDTGPTGRGTLFKVNLMTGELTTVVEFTGNAATNKGATPMGGADE